MSSSKLETAVHTCMTGAEFLDDLDAECLRIFPGLHWIVTRLRQERQAAGGDTDVVDMDVSDQED